MIGESFQAMMVKRRIMHVATTDKSRTSATDERFTSYDQARFTRFTRAVAHLQVQGRAIVPGLATGPVLDACVSTRGPCNSRSRRMQRMGRWLGPAAAVVRSEQDFAADAADTAGRIGCSHHPAGRSFDCRSRTGRTVVVDYDSRLHGGFCLPGNKSASVHVLIASLELTTA